MAPAGIDADGWALLIASPAIGSFLGLLIRRVPDGMPVAWTRSRCPHCGASLAARDLIPLASWLVARGRCRHCGHPLGWFYPAVELAAFGIAAISLGVDEGAAAWLDALLGWWLLALAWIDVERWLLPDPLTLPLIVAGLGAAALWAPHALFERAIGAGLGYLGLRAAGWAYRRWRQREGLGAGDAKLLAASGAWVGAAALPELIVAAAVTALLSAGGLALSGRTVRRDTALPFGPFLALATWSIWLFGA